MSNDRSRTKGGCDDERPWFEVAFSADYLERYAHRDQAEAENAVDALVRRMPLAEGSIVLDLCCGAGRHAAALARRGLRVVGLDLSRDLLCEANSIPGPCGAAVAEWIRGDMRQLPLADASVDAVAHFFTAFGYFESDEENFCVLKEVARVLKPDGWYALDFLNAERVREEFARCAEEQRIPPAVTCSPPQKRLIEGGRRVEKILSVRRGESMEQLRESVRLFDRHELRGALECAGLALEQEWGDYDGSAFAGACSPRWIGISRRVNSAT